MQADTMPMRGKEGAAVARPSWWTSRRLKLVAAGVGALVAVLALAAFEFWFAMGNAAPTLMMGSGRVEANPPRSEPEFHRRVESGYYGSGTRGIANYPGAASS